MNKYKWTHEFQVREDGIYEVRYMTFRGKKFYYNEALTDRKHKHDPNEATFDTVLCKYYSSRIPEDPFNLGILNVWTDEDIDYKAMSKSYLWKTIVRDSAWHGCSLKVSVKED